MNAGRTQTYFLLLLIAIAALLAYSVLQPLLLVLALAVIFATLLDPVHKVLTRRLGGRRGLASLVTILLLAIFVITPLIFLGVQIGSEAQALYATLGGGAGRGLIENVFVKLSSSVNAYIPNLDTFSLDLDLYLKQALSFLLNHLGSIFSRVASFVGSTFLFLIALFYLLRDGDKLRERLVTISPLADNDDNAVITKLARAINSVVRGGLLIALIQGALSSVGYLIFGLPNPFLWGAVTAIAALIPGIGTALILIPAILFLLATGSVVGGVGLAIWGVVAVGLIDNILGPKLVGHGTALHPLIVLFSVLGGLAYFGPLGFLLGPLAMSLLFALLDIYFSQASISV